MPRPSKDRRRAVERLAQLLPGIKATLNGRVVRITGPRGFLPMEKPTVHALSFLADLAKHDPELDGGEVRYRVAWSGRPPTTGLSAWEEVALTWLSVADE